MKTFKEYINEAPSSDIMLKSLTHQLKKSGYKTKIDDKLKSKTVIVLDSKFKISVGGVFAGQYTLFETAGSKVKELISVDWNEMDKLIKAISK